MNPKFVSLLQTLDQLDTTGRPIDLFFRDDDVDVKEDSLRRMMDVFYAHRVPVNLEVIPGRLTDEAIYWLRVQQALYPSLIELNQHGWLHVNHEPEGRKCEFGTARAFEEQFADIVKGKRRMDEAFPGAWHPVFTPPWNRCSADTYLAIEALGYQVLSKDCGKTPVTAYRFAEVSTSIDLYRWKGQPLLKEPEEIFEALNHQCQTRRRIGILLHHKVMNSAAFSFLSFLLDTLCKYRTIRFHHFQSLLRESCETSIRGGRIS